MNERITVYTIRYIDMIQSPQTKKKLECNKVRLIEVYKFTQSIKRNFTSGIKVIQIHLRWN